MWRITRQPRYPLRIGASRVAPAPLANRKIAFGCGRLAIRASASRSLCCGRVIRHRWHGRDCVAGLRLAPPPRNRLWSRALHPSANAACMAWSGYLPSRGCLRTLRVRLRRIFPPLRFGASATPPRGVCRARAADCALAPLACAPPLARCRYMPVFARRKRRRLHRLPEPLLRFAQPWHGMDSLTTISAFQREAWRGGGDTRRSKRRRRDAADAANAGARRDGRYSDQAPRAAVADGWRALRRMRAR